MESGGKRGDCLAEFVRVCRARAAVGHGRNHTNRCIDGDGGEHAAS
jgi:hypothetical protein